MTIHTYTHKVTLPSPRGKVRVNLAINYNVRPDMPQALAISINCWELTGPGGPLDCPKWLADIFTPNHDKLLQFAADDLQAEAEDRADARRDINREDE